MHGIDDLKGLVDQRAAGQHQPAGGRQIGGRASRRAGAGLSHDEIEKALHDLSTGGCDAFMKLTPVTARFVRDRKKLKVVGTGITVGRLASACARAIPRYMKPSLRRR